MRKPLILLAALLVVTPACSAFGTAPAATIGGIEISAKSIEDEITYIQSNEGYRAALEQAYGSPTSGTSGEGTFSAAFTAQLLSLRVWYELIEQDLERRKVAITDDALAQGESETRSQFSQLGDDVFDGFPDEYRERLVRQRALIAVVDQDITDEIGDDPRAFFRAHPDEFADICLSHVLVAVQDGRTVEEARDAVQAMRDRIEAGEDFETIATEESDDPGAASQGGSLGCGSKQSLQFVPDFERAAFALDEGELSEPVVTQFGAHLILVTERTVPRFAEVEASIPTAMQQYREVAINDYIVGVICGTDVSINPRFGTWSSETCEGPAPRLPSVVPPEGPVGAEPEPELDFGG